MLSNSSILAAATDGGIELHDLEKPFGQNKVSLLAEPAYQTINSDEVLRL